MVFSSHCDPNTLTATTLPCCPSHSAGKVCLYIDVPVYKGSVELTQVEQVWPQNVTGSYELMTVFYL